MIIDENHLSPAHNILSTTKLEISNKKTTPPPHTTIDQNGYYCNLAPISAYGIAMLLPAKAEIATHPSFVQKLCNIKIAKKKVRMQTPLVNPIIDMERPFEKVLKKGEYIAIKCHNNLGDNESGSYEISLHYYGGGSPEEWFVWKDKLLWALDGQSISIRPLRYIFT